MNKEILMKKMIYGVAVFLILTITCCSTEIEFAQSERIAIEGRVLDEDGKALENVPVEVFPIYRCNSLFGYEYTQTMVASDFSDENGYYKAYTMQPSNETILYIAVNKGTDLRIPSEVSSTKPYSGRVIYFTKDDVINNVFNASDVKINKEKAQLNINLVIDPSDSRNLYFSIRNKNNVNYQLADTAFIGFEYQTTASISYVTQFDKNSQVIIPVVAYNNDILNIFEPKFDTVYVKMDSLIKNITINL